MFGPLRDRLSRDNTWTYVPCHTCGKHVREVGLERVVIAEDSASQTCIDICLSVPEFEGVVIDCTCLWFVPSLVPVLAKSFEADTEIRMGNWISVL